jgi:hypothetical protein
MAPSVYHSGCWQLRKVWSQRNFLVRRSFRSDFLMTSQSIQFPLPEEPIRNKYLMTSQTKYPWQSIQSEATYSWQLSQSNLPGTLENLRGSFLAGGHGRMDSNWVDTWRNFTLLCGEGMSLCLESSEHERWIQGQLPTLSTSPAAFPFSTLSFSCGLVHVFVNAIK